jgi:hypothetical protein
VIDKYSFTALDINNVLIDNLSEKDINVTLPDKGGKVKVVKGDYAGIIG